MMQRAARILTRGVTGATTTAAVGTAGSPAGGALVARHVIGGGSSSATMSSSSSSSSSYSPSWRESLTNGSLDGGIAIRGFAHASTPSYHGHSHGDADADAEKITVTFIEKDGTETIVQARIFLFYFSRAFQRGAEKRFRFRMGLVPLGEKTPRTTSTRVMAHFRMTHDGDH